MLLFINFCLEHVFTASVWSLREQAFLSLWSTFRADMLAFVRRRTCNLFLPWNICMLPDSFCHRKCYLTSLAGAAWQWDSHFARDWSSKSSSVTSNNQHKHPQMNFVSSHAPQINYSNSLGAVEVHKKFLCSSLIFFSFPTALVFPLFCGIPSPIS